MSKRNTRSSSANDEASAAAADAREAKSSTSSMSSSEDDGSTAKGSWTIELSNFSKTKTMLETAINNSSKRSDLMEAYFGENKSALSKLPWEDNRPEYGIFPLHKFFYEACSKEDEGAVVAVAPDLYVKYTVDGLRFMNEMKTDEAFSEYFEANKYTWGNVKGTCIGTYFQMLVYPKLAHKAFRRLVDVNKKQISSISRK